MRTFAAVALVAAYGAAAWWFTRKSPPTQQASKSKPTKPKPNQKPTKPSKPIVTDKPGAVVNWEDLTGTTDNMTTGQPRGIRNNNPLNIEFSTRNNWRGQVGSDGRFSIFEDDKWGFRAGARILRSYQKRGINTIHSIVHTFAPSHENNSDHYADMVSRWSGYDKHEMVDVRNDTVAAKIIKAMARMEVGKKYAFNEVMEGVALA